MVRKPCPGLELFQAFASSAWSPDSVRHLRRRTVDSHAGLAVWSWELNPAMMSEQSRDAPPAVSWCARKPTNARLQNPTLLGYAGHSLIGRLLDAAFPRLSLRFCIETRSHTVQQRDFPSDAIRDILRLTSLPLGNHGRQAYYTPKSREVQ